jgi:hypothetical protein
MRPDAPEKAMVSMNLKSETVKHIDAGLPPVFVTLHFLSSKGRMFDVLHKKPHLLFKDFPDMQADGGSLF